MTYRLDSLAYAHKPWWHRFAMSRTALGGVFSFRRMVEGMALGSLDGAEREFLQEASKAVGQTSFDSQRVVLPLAMFRNLAAASGSDVGHANVLEPAEILRPWSVAARAGITIQNGLVTEVPPIVGQIAIPPKTGGAFSEFSRQISLQTKSEFLIQRELLRTVGTLVDVAVFNGNNAAGQPTVLLNTPGIDIQQGSPLFYSGVTVMKQVVTDANAPDNAIAYIGTPAIRKLLENRERDCGSGYIWDGDKMASRPAYVTTYLPVGTLVCGAWSELFLGLWGSCLEFMVNSDPTGFKTGTIQARVLVSCDTAIMQPAAFSVATSVT